MINISHLRVCFNDTTILDYINYVFNSHGLYVILGDSGSGKTTLINAINGTIKYEGNIYFDDINIENCNYEDKQIYRLSNIGNIYQHFSLFDNLSIYDNVALIKDSLSPNSKVDINQILKQLNIYKLKNHLVKNISGGEKQRTAITRGIINNPKVVLADEPTGSLDEYNSKQIMEILKKISVNRLVIMVTHDYELIKQYADFIVYLKDGKIIKSVELNNFIKTNKTINNKIRAKKVSIQSNFLLKYTISKFKEHKIRTSINISSMSLAFFGLGLSFSISNTIYSSVKNVYSNLIEDNRVLITPKKESESLYKEAADLVEVMDIVYKYGDYISDYGIYYNGDYQNIFLNRNVCKYSYENVDNYIPGLSFKNIANYIWIEESENTIFPNIKNLNEDEIVLGLTLNHIRDICKSLSIKQSIESLGDFLSKNNIKCIFEFANYDWEYEDEQIFTIKGVCLDKAVNIYHSDHHWNEKVIEKSMRIPAKKNFSNLSVAPWVLNKAYYLKIKNNNCDFIDFAAKEITLDPFLFELRNRYYQDNAVDNPSLVKELLVFNRPNNDLLIRYDSYIRKEIPNLKSPIYCSNGGYASYSSILMSGFSCPMYFSSDKEKLIEISDLFDELLDNTSSYVSSNHVIEGHFTKNHRTNMTFSINDEYDLSYDEILISGGVRTRLFNNDNPIGNKLYISYFPNASKETIFKDLTIKGVIENDRYCLYHKSNWTTTFFQSQLGVSIFDLMINSISYEIEPSFNFEQSKKALSKAFPKLELIAPMQDIESSLKDVTFYVTLILLIITIISSIMSILINLLTESIYEQEISKDMNIARNLGFGKKEITKFSKIQSILLISSSLLISFVLVFIIAIVISTNFFNHVFNLSAINPISFLIMLAFALVIYIMFLLKAKHNK